MADSDDRAGGRAGFASGRLGVIAAVSLLACAAVASAWALAHLECWAEDEAGTLWQASDILAGRVHRLGLVSSTGIRNMIGAPLVAVPFAWLPDLLAISRALSAVHLAALCPLGLLIGRTPIEKVLAVAVLWFNPALVLSSFSLWNQYLARLASVAILALLLYLLLERGGAKRRALAVLAYAALALLQPAIHLVHFPDLAIHLVLLLAVLRMRPAPLDARLIKGGAMLLAFIVPQLYGPWWFDTAGRLDAGALRTVTLLAVAAGAAIALLAWYGPARVVERGRALRQWPALAPLAAALFCFTLPAVLFFSFAGAQVVRRLLKSELPAIFGLLVVQVAIAVAVLPLLAALWAALRTRRGALLTALEGDRAPIAALLLGYAALLVAARLALGVMPWSRGDLWVSLTPAFLASALVLLQSHGRLYRPVAALTAGAAVLLLGWLAVNGPGVRYRQLYTAVVPASEMREAIDWIAARHRAEAGGDQVDLGYDLGTGKEWIPRRVTRHPAFRWYSIGRPYDWLLRRRHGLANLHEGEVDRMRGEDFLLSFRDQPPESADWTEMKSFDRLVVWRHR
ncbi:MAG: hypothetical protein AB7V27_08245 [Candidatus Binatia bacterium]